VCIATTVADWQMILTPPSYGNCAIRQFFDNSPLIILMRSAADLIKRETTPGNSATPRYRRGKKVPPTLKIYVIADRFCSQFIV